MKNKKRFFALFLTFLFAFSSAAFAHSGRTDANGGHRDTRNVSGLGSYHYHHGYSAHLHPNGVCPYSSTAKKTTGTTKATTAKTTTSTKTSTQTKTNTSAKTAAKTTQTVTKTTAPAAKKVSLSVFVNSVLLAGPVLQYDGAYYIPLEQMAKAIPATVDTTRMANSVFVTSEDQMKSKYVDEFVIFVPLIEDPYYHKMDCPVLQKNGLASYLSMDIGFIELGAVDSVSPCPTCIHS